MKVARLVSIVIILLNKGSVTARELAERFEVSTRTIYRDIEALAEAGIPVFATQGNSGGIALMDNCMLDRTLVTEAERDGLLLAVQTLQAAHYPQVELMLDKLGALFKDAPADWVQVEFSPWGSGPGEEAKFHCIRKAILARTVLEFDYVSADGRRSRRVAEPVKLYFKGSAWYIWAWCRERSGFRTFRITRIKNLESKPETFAKREFTPPAQSEARQRQKVRLHLRFQPQVMYRVYDDFDDTSVTRNNDGTLELWAEYPEDEWVYGYLMSYGPDLEVLEPGHIRTILRARLQEALKKYCRDPQI